MVNYKEAIKLPFSDAKKFWIMILIWLGYLVVSVLLNLVFMPLLKIDFRFTYLANIIMMFVLSVPLLYYISIKNSKKLELPELSSINFKDALRLGLVIVVYAIPFYVFMVLAIIGIFGTDFYTQLMTLSMLPEELQQIVMQGMLQKFAQSWHIVVPIMIIIALLNYFIITSAQLNFVKTKKLKDAFDFGKVLKNAFNGKFMLSVIVSSLMILAYVILMMLVMFLLILSVVGVFLLPLVVIVLLHMMMATFYGIVIQAYPSGKKAR